MYSETIAYIRVDSAGYTENGTFWHSRYVCQGSIN